MRAAILSSAVPPRADAPGGLLGGDPAEPSAAGGDGRTVAGGRRRHARQRLERGGRPNDRQAGGAGGTLCTLAVRRDGGTARGSRPGEAAVSLDLDKPFAGLWAAARGVVEDDKAAESERIAAVRAPGPCRARRTPMIAIGSCGLLRPRVSGRPPAGGRDRARSTDRCPSVADLLLHDWKKYSPQVRGAILDALLEPTDLDVFATVVARGWLRAARRNRPGPTSATSRDTRSRALRPRRGRLRSSGQPRQAIVKTYRSALGITGNRAAGGGGLSETVCVVPPDEWGRGRGRP